MASELDRAVRALARAEANLDQVRAARDLAIAAALREGMPPGEVSRRAGISPAHVRRIARAAGITSRR